MKPENLNLQSDCYHDREMTSSKLARKDWGIAHVLMRYLGEEAESEDFTFNAIIRAARAARIERATHSRGPRAGPLRPDSHEELLRRDKR